jgi:hypothetical protein
MPDTPITSAQFEHYLGEAEALALDAITNFGLFYFLTIPRQRTQYAQILAKHKQVLSLIPPAAFSTLILSLHKLLENARSPVSIYRCISMACQLSLINRDKAKSLKKRVQHVVPIWKKVGEVRNLLIAHRDCGIPISEVFKTTSVSPKELRLLALTYWEVLNALRAATGKPVFDADLCCEHLFRALDSFMTDLLYAAKRR